MRALAAAMLTSLALAGCDTTRVGDPEPVTQGSDLVDRGTPPMTAAEVRIYLSDSTLEHEGDTRIWHVYLGADGVLRGTSTDKETGGIERARGTWEVTPAGQICRQWENDWAAGLAGCATVYRFRQEYLFVPVTEGVEEFRRTRLPGNPMNL